MVLWAVVFSIIIIIIIVIAAHPVYNVFFHRAGPAVPAHTGSIFMLLTLSNPGISFFLVRLRVSRAVEVLVFPEKRWTLKCRGCIQAAIFCFFLFF